MSLIVRFLLLAIVLAFYSNNSMASSQCWADLKPSSTAPRDFNFILKPFSTLQRFLKPSSTLQRYFILAMGANTGELTMANHDAQAFANAMQKRFNVPSSQMCVLKDVKKGEFKNALKGLQELVKNTDTLYIYFSGHGKRLKDIKNPDEKDCFDEAFVMYHPPSLRDDDFVSLVNDINTNHIITFIDACFASGMLRGKRKKGCPTGIKTKFQLNPKTAGTLQNKFCPSHQLKKKLKGKLYAAAKEDQLAWESPKKGGIFTYIFLKNMNALPDGTLDEIFKQTAEEVALKTKDSGCQQQPKRWK